MHRPQYLWANAAQPGPMGGQALCKCCQSLCKTAQVYAQCNLHLYIGMVLHAVRIINQVSAMSNQPVMTAKGCVD